MPERQDVKIEKVGLESAVQRKCGLQVLIERLLLRLLQNPCTCVFCRGLLENEAEEEVIEF
jgi:hypothetical protein